MRNIIAIATLVAGAIGLAACGGGSSGTATASTSSGPAISTAKGVLVDAGGMTLYSLSVEKQGHIICTGACLKLWHPVLGKPSGSVGSLGTIRRPDGKVQAAYKGKPLYRFASDTAPGDKKGEGFKDVGTWHVAGTATTKPASSGGYSSGY